MPPRLTRLLITLIAASFARAAYVVYPPRYEISNAQYAALSSCIKPAHDEGAPESRYDPICATDGFSYYNKHEMRCLGKAIPSVMFSFFGRCPNEPIFLPMESARGTELLKNPKAFDGYQKCLEGCTDFRPVCGSDGRTYSNECAVNCAQQYNPQLTMDSRGFCKQDKSVEGICPDILQPFCGSDGITYLNYCHLKFAMLTESLLQPAHMGDCVRRLVAIEGALTKKKSGCGCGGGGGGGCGGSCGSSGGCGGGGGCGK